MKNGPPWLDLLPATVGELAALLGISTHQANARLDRQRKRNRVKRGQRFIRTRRRPAALWERI